LIFAGPGIKKGKVVHSPAEMLSIYPTLLDLCGLEPYERNEGFNLAPLLRGETETAGEFALTTYGWGIMGSAPKIIGTFATATVRRNFTITTDPNEWNNLATRINRKWKWKT
jgi:iduronate 2-sulfatase